MPKRRHGPLLSYVALLLGLSTSGCVPTRLQVPPDHPGNPQAHSGRAFTSDTLAPSFDPLAQPVADRARSGAAEAADAHGHHHGADHGPKPAPVAPAHEHHPEQP